SFVSLWWGESPSLESSLALLVSPPLLLRVLLTLGIAELL
ncbi:hypothetical protein A2U01_0117884, partial [Trifolium medium]|nr:hypothetical protein [Trifolium medium]